jgi:hypothetical protein
MEKVAVDTGSRWWLEGRQQDLARARFVSWIEKAGPHFFLYIDSKEEDRYRRLAHTGLLT